MYKRVLKKLSLYLVASFLLSFSTLLLYVISPKLIDSIDFKLRDSMFLYRGELAQSNSIIIIDIDEKSLKEFGQWPWSRDKLAQIVTNLNLSKVAAIGMDIVFAEEDRTSPSRVASFSANYDEMFAKAIADAPVILGYSFDLNNNAFSSKEPPSIPAIFIENSKTAQNDFLLKASGTTINIPVIQDSAYSSGFFNIMPDDDGILRSVPLFISYDDMLYPSLALELLRVLKDVSKVTINYNQSGLDSIDLGDVKIPTDRYGRVFINYRGGERSFKYFSAIDIYNNNFNKEDIEGKIAILGTSAAGLFDLRSTPFDTVFAGVEVHANVIDNILRGDFLQKASWSDGVNITLVIALSFLTILLITLTPFWLNIPIFILLVASFLTLNYQLLFNSGYIINIIYPLFTIIVGFIIAMAMDYFYNIQKQKAIKAKFASKVSKSVMDDILKNMDSNSFSVKTKEITIFFSDIRGFTSISEKLTPTKLIKYLNQYMDPMSKIIIKHNGTIDKYIGDAIMAYWNAPLDVANHADEALHSAIEQLYELKNINQELQGQNLPPISIGIGLNSGEVIVGEMGSTLRSDYTVIGDTINLGSRVESLCKFYGSQIIITEFTKELLKDSYIFRFLDLVMVKGKQNAIKIYEVLLEPHKDLPLYHQAIDLYHNSHFKQALDILTTLDENVKVHQIYISRCSEFIQTPPKNFNGVYEQTSK